MSRFKLRIMLTFPEMLVQQQQRDDKLLMQHIIFLGEKGTLDVG